MLRRWFLAWGATLLFAPALHATQFEFDGQVRLRFEAMDSTFVAGEPEWTIPLRARLGLHAVVSENVRAYVQVQDSRLFGSEASTLSNEKNLDLHQAYGEVLQSWSAADWRLRGGRQILSYGNERILGAVDWSNVGRSFDAVQSRLQRGAWTLDVVAARLATQSTGPNDSDDLFFSYNRYQGPQVAAELYAMYRDDSRGFYETTLGEHVAGNLGRVRFDQEFATQLGRRHEEDLEAYLFSAQAHVRLAERGKPSVGAGIDFLSGDPVPGDGRFELFDVNRIFHTGHKFYGLMDVAPRLAGAAGLVDPYVGVSISGWVHAAATLHVFHVDQQAAFPQNAAAPQTSSAYLGTELDGVLVWMPYAGSRLELGGALFVPGELLEQQGHDTTGGWAYLQSSVDF